MTAGYAGRLGFVDLSTGKIMEEKLEEKLAREFVGGYGLGVRVLWERQKAGINPLGPENTIGFTTGPLTGTPVPASGRYTVVCKSPLTGGWGDANSGGFFGDELKKAGWDAVFVSGVAPSSKYLLITNDGIQIKDASHLWGKDTVKTEDMLFEELGDSKIRVACIGPAAERLSLISGIVTDKGRIAARSGVGAVMGSKLLKAVAVRGKSKVAVAESERTNQLRREFVKQMRNSPFLKGLIDYGTCDSTAALIAGGATPIKNWLLAGNQGFPTADKIANKDTIMKYQVKRYGCANCPISCGGFLQVSTGNWPIAKVHKPEYETLAAFGTMCMNDDILSIIKLTDMCNRSSLDVISTGTVIAFAMECFEHGIISQVDTDGIELTWGNAQAIITMVNKMIVRDGFGDVLADGVKIAAQRIGKGAEQFAMHVGGQEPGLHNALFWPGRGTGFVADPTPGRHTTGGPFTRVDSNAILAPYTELKFSGFERYEYTSKGEASATASNYWQVGACSGVCLFPVVYSGIFHLLDFFNAVTGWNISMKETLETGARIQTLRQLFNMREGIEISKIRLPDRMTGIPPKNEGPVSGITIDVDSLTKEYRKAMEWDPDTGYPTEAVVKRLGLQSLIRK